jgi:hypothetical protein
MADGDDENARATRTPFRAWAARACPLRLETYLFCNGSNRPGADPLVIVHACNAASLLCGTSAQAILKNPEIL